jgi:phosphatidyl-myo-inositol dimannoside synthase
VGEAVGASGERRLSTMSLSGMRTLALVTDAFGGHGGIAQYNRNLLSSLAQSEQAGDIIVLPRGGATPAALPSGIRQLAAVNGRIAYSLAAIRAAQAHRPIDTVFCGHPYMAPLAAILARFLRARLWVQVHGVDAWNELSAVYRHSIETADLVTAVSRYTRRRLLQWCGIDPVRVKVLPNTVESHFSPGPKPAYLIDRHGLHGNKVLLSVSRLVAAERYKGHDRVIRILPRVLVNKPETTYVIVGDGDDRPRLESLALKLQLKEAVRFVGRVAPEELPDYFRLADVFVMPSTGEGFGIVFLEASASGIPVIGGNRDGSLDALSSSALARAVDPENQDELVSAICAALDNPVRRPSGALTFKLPFFADHVHAVLQSSLIRPQRCAIRPVGVRPGSATSLGKT